MRVKEVSREVIKEMLLLQDELSEVGFEARGSNEYRTNLSTSTRLLHTFVMDYVSCFPEEFEWCESLRNKGFLMPVIDRFGKLGLRKEAVKGDRPF